MRVLLIGKHPPMQGGIAARTYWLARALRRQRIGFAVVTSSVPGYSHPVVPDDDTDLFAVVQTTAPDAPWFIPGGDLQTERLVTAALSMVERARPHAVEANYLAPYGLAASLVARDLGVPLIVRHAGSDIAKLSAWEPAASAVRAVLRAASVVVTASDTAPRIETLGVPPDRLAILPRYVPDPAAFPPTPSPTPDPGSPPILLVAGKLNYHWRRKGLDVLLNALKCATPWCLHLVGDGTAANAVRERLRKSGITGRAVAEGFVHPASMPGLLARCTAVWAVHDSDHIGDPSNLVWEAVATGRPCLVAPGQLRHPDIRRLADLGADLRPVDLSNPAAIIEVLAGIVERPARPDRAAIDLPALYEGYIEAHQALYASAATGAP